MKTLATLTLLVLATAAAAANLVSETELDNGKRVCVYSDGTSIVTSFNHCPSFK